MQQMLSRMLSEDDRYSGDALATNGASTPALT
jgi:hypothetical protein